MEDRVSALELLLGAGDPFCLRGAERFVPHTLQLEVQPSVTLRETIAELVKRKSGDGSMWSYQRPVNITAHEHDKAVVVAHSLVQASDGFCGARDTLVAAPLTLWFARLFCDVIDGLADVEDFGERARAVLLAFQTHDRMIWAALLSFVDPTGSTTSPSALTMATAFLSICRVMKRLLLLLLNMDGSMSPYVARNVSDDIQRRLGRFSSAHARLVELKKKKAIEHKNVEILKLSSSGLVMRTLYFLP